MRPVHDQFRDVLRRRYSHPDERDGEISLVRVIASSGEDPWSPNLHPIRADIIGTR